MYNNKPVQALARLGASKRNFVVRGLLYALYFIRGVPEALKVRELKVKNVAAVQLGTGGRGGCFPPRTPGVGDRTIWRYLLYMRRVREMQHDHNMYVALACPTTWMLMTTR